MKTLNTAEFEQAFEDNQEEIVQFLDLSSAKRPNKETKRVNVDFPIWMVESLDKEAEYLGVPRQALIKLWIAERLPEYRTA